MVRKIEFNEYLKRYDNMLPGERQEYLDRVGKWLEKKAAILKEKTLAFEARLQSVLQVSGLWNDAECAAFEEGAKLLSALFKVTETELPDNLYAISAKRSIKKMVKALRTILYSQTLSDSPEGESTEEGSQTGEPAETKETQQPLSNSPEGERKPTEKPSGTKDAQPTFNVQCSMFNGKSTAVRPKHIDQYVHLLPKKTQEKAAKVQELYREMDALREKERLLMDAEGVKSDDREAVAKAIVKVDNALNAIFRELDSEWEKLVKSGSVVVDDLGNARVVNTSPALPMEVEPDGEPSGTGEASGTGEEQHAELTKEQKARRRELRKKLVDTRRGNGATRKEHIKRWKEAFKEYLTLEGDDAYQDAKIKEAAEHYGIKLK